MGGGNSKASGGEGRYSNHDICLKGRLYSDKGRADGCYDRTDKFCSTDRSDSTETVKGQSSAGSCPSAHSNSRGGEGRNRNSGSSDNHHESNRGGSVTQTTFVGKVLSEADKYGLNSSVYQQQVNTMSDYELSKQYQEWKALEKRILVGKVLSQYSEATGKSIDEGYHWLWIFKCVNSKIGT